MSQIAPDIPELAHLPEVVRPIVWMRALSRAVRLRTVRSIAATSVFAATVAGAVMGSALGPLGALAFGFAAGAIALYVILKFVVPRHARSLIPVVEKEVDWNAQFGAAIRAEERIKKVVASGKHVDKK